MNFRHWIALAVVVVGPAGASSADESVLVVRPGETMPIEIDGVKGRAVIEPSEPHGLALNPDLAARLAVNRSRCRTGSNIGPVRVDGACKEAWIDFGGRRFSRHVIWFGVPVVIGADVMLNPFYLPHQIIRLEFHPAAPGERVVSLPLFDFSRYGHGFGTEIMLNQRPVQIYFGLKRARPLATAGAGSVIAAAQGGRLVGQPRPMPIDLGVTRPVQVMILDRPLTIGPLSIDRLGVRVADYGRTRVPEARLVDPNEIVVTGNSRRDRRYDWLSVGRDALAHCSSLTIDKRRKTLTLSCR